MRYEDWDVLIFPKDSKVPVKEFKTQCHVVQDHDFAFTHGSYGLPTLTCFVPGLLTGSPFSISMHSWSPPEVSPFTKTTFSKHEELVVFEARIFLDGRLTASASFDRHTDWPQLISHGFEFNRNGDLENLKFPYFHSELVRQSYWSPADEVGRIRVVISEGFPRDSLSVPIERVKNIVAFSFQHAPIDVLEASSIAWPNPAMWRRGPFTPTMPVPTNYPGDGADAHIHSPRRRSGQPMQAHLKDNSPSFMSSMPNTQNFLQGTSYVDAFESEAQTTSSADIDWTASLIPSELAATLTSSLLNQPTPGSCLPSTTYSPPSSRTFSGVFSSRSASGSEFGQSFTNVNPVATVHNKEFSGEKAAKRSRHATPASIRALGEEAVDDDDNHDDDDDDDEQQGHAAQIRIGFGEGMVN